MLLKIGQCISSVKRQAEVIHHTEENVELSLLRGRTLPNDVPSHENGRKVLSWDTMFMNKQADKLPGAEYGGKTLTI